MQCVSWPPVVPRYSCNYCRSGLQLELSLGPARSASYGNSSLILLTTRSFGLRLIRISQAMDGVATRPALWTKVSSRYGRCDYERFDNISSSHRVGHGMIGNIAVDCRFLFTKSQWGTIGNNMNPAGIVYLDLDFDQPADTRLRSATVLVTLKEYEGRERRSQTLPAAVITKDNRLPCPVKFTHHYGPKHFHGRERTMRTLREKHLTPNVNILGYGAGGVGLTSKQESNKVSRWKFSGHLDSSKGCIWYDTLKWTLEENELESQSLHSNVLHTAFAFEHNADEFYMTVEVKGKLLGLSVDRLRNKMKNKMMRFGGGEGRSRDTVTTKFQWTNGYSCPKRLDKVAEGLEYAMEYENLYEVPFEMPDTLPAQFRPMAEPRSPVLGNDFHSQKRPPESAWPGLPEIPTGSQGMNEVPTLDELARAAGFSPTAESASVRGPPDTYQASESSSSTLLGSSREGSLVNDLGTKPEPTEVDAKSKSYAHDGQSDIEMLIWLTRMPLIAIVLKLVAVVVSFRAKGFDGRTTDTESEDEEVHVENARLRACSSTPRGVNRPANGSASGVLDGNSYARRRNVSSLTSGLERIEEVNPEVAPGDKAQGDHHLDDSMAATPSG